MALWIRHYRFPILVNPSYGFVIYMFFKRDNFGKKKNCWVYKKNMGAQSNSLDKKFLDLCFWVLAQINRTIKGREKE